MYCAKMGKFYLMGFLLLIVSFKSNAFPTDSTLSLVTTTEASTTAETSSREPGSKNSQPKAPKIYQMHVKSDVGNRYANTTIASKVKNLANTSQEAVFSVILPEKAFISGFIMEINGKNYTAFVKEKEEAKQIYNEALDNGIGAAHIAVNARDSNRFTVSVNVEPESKAAFYLNYEELLKRRDGYYELVINIHPGQPVSDLDVEVTINESRKITDLKTPPLRSGNEIGNENSELDPRATVNIINDTNAVVKFSPNLEKQKELAKLLGTNNDGSLAGQFVVRYEVERDPQGGEVIVKDGYFVHFFAPTEIPSLPKHVVFILDTSYSMEGEKIKQLKEAMLNILNELKPDDLFNVIEFSTNVKVWNLDDANKTVLYPNDIDNTWTFDESPQNVMDYIFPNAYTADANYVRKARENVDKLEPNGGTNIYDALIVGSHMVDLTQNNNTKKNNLQPLIIFLTDGEATVGIVSPDEIIEKLSEYTETSTKSPIFALSFGDGADKNFLQKLSSQNLGFSRHIYEAADASLQLQDFYRQISSPLLSDVTFKYQPSATSLTETNFPIHFDGSELVVAGWCGTDDLYAEIDGLGIDGPIQFTPVIENAISSTERLWAYITLNQLLDKKETSSDNKEEFKQKALDVALKYSFVTPISSLVVVKPNDTNAVDTEKAIKKERLYVPYAQSLVAPGLPRVPLVADFISLRSSAFLFENRFGEDGVVWELDLRSDDVDDSAQGKELPSVIAEEMETTRVNTDTTKSEVETAPNIGTTTVDTEATPAATTEERENRVFSTTREVMASTIAPTKERIISPTPNRTPTTTKFDVKVTRLNTQKPTTSTKGKVTTASTTTSLINNGETDTTNTDASTPASETTNTDASSPVTEKTSSTDASSPVSKTTNTDASSPESETTNTDASSPVTEKTSTGASSPVSKTTNTDASSPESKTTNTDASTPAFETTNIDASNPTLNTNMETTPSVPTSTKDFEVLTTETNYILSDLPWLENVLNQNETITLQYGEYPLGLNETIDEVVDCPQTPLNGTGHCQLLNSCPDVNALVTSIDVFIKHFCLLRKKYAGICCPQQ